MAKVVNLLSPAQRAKLLQIPVDFPDGEIVRYYTLSPEDLKIIAEHRCSQNRLGIAVQLAYSQHAEKARVDFRQQYADLRYGVHHLPEALEAKILALMRFFRLQYGAIDMIVTPEGDLEINPNGQVAWIEAATELPLFRTLALLLGTGQAEKRAI